MIQIWALPEEPGEPAGYKHYQLEKGVQTPVYGGESGQDETFPAAHGSTSACSGPAKASRWTDRSSPT